jgi:hypothetical protein
MGRPFYLVAVPSKTKGRPHVEAPCYAPVPQARFFSEYPSSSRTRHKRARGNPTTLK